MAYRLTRRWAFFIALGFALPGCDSSAANTPPIKNTPVAVDLLVADDETYKRPVSWSHNLERSRGAGLLAGDATGAASRPGISIAWRNAAQIEEVEVKVQNLGTEPAEGRLFVDITDETGRHLLHLEPSDDQKIVRLPAADRGGRDGRIIRMQASRALNNLIDRFDRMRRRYDVTATIEPTGTTRDADLSNNAKTKSYHTPFRVTPGVTNAFSYTFRNHGPTARRVRWKSEHTQLPPGWKVEGLPASNSIIEFAPGQELKGTVSMPAPGSIDEGAFLETRIALLDADTGQVVQQREWFQVYDTVPPDVSNYRILMMPDQRVAIEALVGDKGSGVMEATGVQTEYSTDGGRTWSSRPHNYTRGNFVTPTTFEAVLGPFAPGTQLQLRFSARDTAGNVQAMLPDDAAASVVGAGTEKLLDRTGIPGGTPSPLFLSKTLSLAPTQLQRVRAPGDDIIGFSTLQVNVR